MFSRFIYSIKQAFSQIWRNKGSSVTALLAITAMMLVLGVFFVAFVNVDLFAKVIQQDYNVVQVYLNEGLTEEQRTTIQTQLETYDGVLEVSYSSKEDALETMKDRWGDSGYLLDNLNENPLPDSFLVYVDDQSVATSLSTDAAEFEGVEDVTFYQDTVEKLTNITDFLEKGSIIVMVFLVLVSVIIVVNTIKLTILNRSKEIGIMKYLGATDWFVRGPFMLEGIILGALSAGFATGLIYFVYKEAVSFVGADILRVLSVTVVPAGYLIGNLAIIFVSLGVGIGTCGSIISIRRFLRK